MKRIRLAAICLAVVMLLTGCGSMLEAASSMKDVGAVGAQWINSDIVGAIDENTVVSVKDDFYTAVNKDWILSRDLGGKDQIVQLFEPQEILAQQMITLLTDPDSTHYRENTTVGMDAEEIAHAGELVAVFSKAAGDTEKRDQLGVEPLRPFLSAIESINDLDALTAFILDMHGQNIVGAPIVEAKVGPSRSDPDHGHVLLSPVNLGYLTLEAPYKYHSIDADGIIKKQINSELIRYVLDKLGYSRREEDSILRHCYRLESRLGEKMLSDYYVESADYEELYGTQLSLEELETMLGDYPIAGILAQYGYDTADTFMVYEPEYMERVADIYQEKYLEEIKAFYIVRTIIAAVDLLDTETMNAYTEIFSRHAKPEESEEPELNRETSEVEDFINSYIQQYIPAPFEMMYIAAYCTGEEKAALTEMVTDIKAQLRDVLSGSDWLSETGRANCVEKLDYMAVKVLFPDKYISYKGLELREDQSLPEMEREISAFNKSRMADHIGQPIDRNEWDLSLIRTTDCNAYNLPTENSINILAGILAGGFMFDPASPYEVNLARLGTVVGHEMTHSFDSNGYSYDKYGRSGAGALSDEPLLEASDRSVFTNLTFSVGSWYAAISPMPGLNTYSASVTAEAIADMGGMRCALSAAADREDFDYDLFFRSYAEMWRKVNTRELEEAYVRGDVHPLAYLRTNVTVQQFDEFMETYGISKGDGMYLAAEDRIALW